VFNITEFSPLFQSYIETQLRRQDMSGRALARLVGCNEGEISHIRRKGHVPTRPMAKAIGEALGDVDACLLTAGYLPRPGYQLSMTLMMAAP